MLETSNLVSTTMFVWWLSDDVRHVQLSRAIFFGNGERFFKDDILRDKTKELRFHILCW